MSDERPPPADVILVLDTHACVVYCSGDVVSTFGRDPAEMAGAPVSMLIEDLSFVDLRETVDLLHADGSRRRATVRVDPWLAAGAKFFTVIIPADAVIAPREYRELAGMFEESQRFAHVGSFSVDVDTRDMRWSDELYRIHGLDPGVRPIDLAYLIARVAPENRGAVAAEFEAALRGGVPLDAKWTIATADGATRVVRACGRLGTVNGRASLYGSILDVTADEQMERERQELARELDEARRMTSLGRVAATMAHEFNNVLAGINSFAEYLIRRTPDDDTRRAASNIRQAIHRGKRVTDEILRYTRASRPRLASVDVRRWLDAFLPEAKALTGGRAMLVCDDELYVRADVAQLNQVLVNLVLNARDASPPDAPIVIRVTTARREGTPMLDLAVIDRGSGIPPDIRDRIFEPLFTTKPGGTGLGLPLVDQVIRAHGGVVRVRTEMGKGSEFHVLLPLQASAMAGSLFTDSVLIADDNEEFADGTRILLEMEGIRTRVVYRAANVIPAMEEEEPDALVLDIGLPDMAGTDVYASIVDRWPSIPVVFVSGQRNHHLEPLLRQRHVAFLEKPFELEELLAALRRVTAAAA
ncbi:MAG TPA: ATP-binding protein [Thermoanaerobaculia bacterium]|nr:ATP-binding protein [Thermoanaerobaculia bacterium]